MKIGTMSAPRELNHPDDFVILTVDVADSPIAELRLSEIYDVETSTINDNYLLVLQDYVALQLKATFGLCDRFKFRLLDSRFIPLHCRANGDIVSLRKPAMERLIRQILQSRLDARSPVSVSLLIQFKTPGFKIPRRSHESPRIPPKIGGITSTSNFGKSDSMLDTEWACAFIPDLNIVPVAHMVGGMEKGGTEHSDSSPPIRFQDSNNDVPLTMTTDIGGTCNLVAGNFIPLLRVISNNCKHPRHVHMVIGTFPPVAKYSYDLWMSNATIMCQLCRSMLMMYRPIDRGRQQ